MTINPIIEPKTRHRRKAAGEIIQPAQRSSIVEGATLALVLILCSLAQAATYYASPTGSGDGSDADHPMAFSSVGAGTSVGDSVHIVGMTEAISHPDVVWPAGRLYYASYVSTTPLPAWTFSEERRIWRFAAGEIGVLGPVTVTAFEPACFDDEGRIKNGSAINPHPDDATQGFDSAYNGRAYSGTTNVADGVDAGNPLVVAAGSSLVSTVARAMNTATETPFARSAVLTVLASAPAEGSFRPPYIGTDKTVKYNKSVLDYTKLAKLTTVTGQPTMASVKGWFAGLWMDYVGAAPGRAMHTWENSTNNYGQYIHCNLGVAACMLHLNLTDAEKEPLLCRYLQAGIDYAAGIALSRLVYAADGGHNGGRKYPVVLAAIMLEDPDIEALLAKTGDYCYEGGYAAGNQPPDYIAFQDDDQTFYVTQLEVTLTTKDLLTGDTWAYFMPSDTPVYDGTIGTTAAGHTVIQDTTGATGTVLHVYDPIYYYHDVVTITHTAGPDFDLTGVYAVVDQTSGGSFTPVYRTRWNYAGTWNPDNRESYPRPYLAEDIGIAEWGIRHTQIPAADNRAWTAIYKSNAAPALHGTALAALLLKGGKTLWNHDAMFDATARFMTETDVGGEGYGMTRSNSPFTSNMWDTYYTTYSDGIPADSDPPVQHRRIRIRATSNPN